MLTETQYKALMILFDDKGHAGWELADTLRMEASNLNPLLKKLEKKNFIFQGPPRKSNRPKRSSKIEKREGDYKEFPYYINNDLEVFGSVIKDMIVTNRSYDLGFPFRKIRGSNYWRSMKGMFKEDFDFYLSDLLRKMNISITRCCIIEEPLRLSLDDLSKLGRALVSLNRNSET
jgi:hypothetical protein